MFSVNLILTGPFGGIGRGTGSVQDPAEGSLQVHLLRRAPPCSGDLY